jgi:hypothetical protein
MTPAPPNAGGDLFAANLKGALLAVASSAFIGVSFIVKKKGLRRAGASGTRAGTHVPGISVASNQKAPPFFLSLSLSRFRYFCYNHGQAQRVEFEFLASF